MEIGSLQANLQASITSLSGADTEAAERAIRNGDDESAAREFESMFARMLVREMRRALPDGPFGGGAGSDVYEGWFDEHLGAALVERDALGLAGMVKAALGRPQAETTGEGQ